MDLTKIALSIAEDLIPGGKGDEYDISQFDPTALGKGILVELEHTDDANIALEIVKDHLIEDSRYYDALEEMEQELKATKSQD